MVATKKTAKSTKAPVKTAKVKEGRTVKGAHAPGNDCKCGCGSPTAGGRFLPGHDARLKSMLQKEYRNGGLSAGGRALVEELGWERFLELPSTGGTASKAQIKLGITTPQVHILKTLAKAQDGLTRGEIKAKAKVSLSMTSQLGPVHTEDVKSSDDKYKKGSLLARGFVICKMEDLCGNDVALYFITAAGRKALEQLNAK